MNTSGLHKVMDFYFHECPRILDLKGREYACLDGDRLKNFKETADELGGVPEYSCANHLYKQMKSIFQIVNDLMSGLEMFKIEKNLAEPWEGRIVDAINYLILLAALIHERKENENGGSSGSSIELSKVETQDPIGDTPAEG